jgi:hypothetical protein
MWGFPAGWQSGYAEDCKSSYSGSIPLPASIHSSLNIKAMRIDATAPMGDHNE